MQTYSPKVCWCYLHKYQIHQKKTTVRLQYSFLALLLLPFWHICTKVSKGKAKSLPASEISWHLFQVSLTWVTFFGHSIEIGNRIMSCETIQGGLNSGLWAAVWTLLEVNVEQSSQEEKCVVRWELSRMLGATKVGKWSLSVRENTDGSQRRDGDGRTWVCAPHAGEVLHVLRFIMSM